MIEKLTSSDVLRPMVIGDKVNELIDAFNKQVHGSQPIVLDEENSNEENSTS